VLLVTDSDGDGYGTSQGMSMIGCPPVPGFATTFDDCNDTNAAINPGAPEVANVRDDNCNGKVDDVSAMPGTGCTTSGAGGTTSAPLGSPPPDAGGCALSGPARLTPLHGFGATFLLGAVAWRRITRRLRKNTLSA
jgi:hypothetical protein